MINCLNGLLIVNIELSSRCNKVCFCCGRRKLKKNYPELAKWGDIDFDLLKIISDQLPDNIVIQFHNNGESLLYPRFGEAIRLFDRQIKCMDTNAKLLIEKADEIIDNLDTLTISVIEDDPEAEEQFMIVNEFLKIKENRKPFMIYRLLGSIDKNIEKEYSKLQGLIAKRILHNPMGSFDYSNSKKPAIPEIGICLDLLSHLVIDRYGDVYPCVRFNPFKENLLGNVRENTLEEMWNGDLRQFLISKHIKGNRDCSPLCSKCQFYGVPTC